ncbi:hypothetical protein [Anaerorhabdus furcosa]|uniref:Uncharacterized protein n=1 Tax=Anaerorhabdus furcosa TaxID=118967 RepID=A0A1T4PL87_9FIRM|nr:hypothetical protein [Anaerorhabdus furcosa]SJZ92016.1 hypothetical protein SAMN02745191_2084 [Anaerorhabdus furcosa]
MLKKYRKAICYICVILLLLLTSYSIYITREYHKAINGYNPLGTYSNQFIDQSEFYQELVIYYDDGLKCDIYNQFEIIIKSKLNKISSNLYKIKLNDNSVYYLEIKADSCQVFSEMDKYEYEKLSNNSVYANIE